MKKEFRNIYIASIFMFVIYVTGVAGFIYIENYTFVEAMFMTIITMSTVGYEEVHRLSPQGMMFTGGLIIVSLGFFGYLVTSITRLFVDGDYRRYLKRYYTNKKIQKLKDHVVVCGLGRNGRQATIDLIAHGEKVVIIEREKDVIENEELELLLQSPDIAYVVGDASHEETLEKANYLKAKALIATLPSDAENLLIVLTARSENPTMKIISRASDDHVYTKLLRAGANNVIMPDIVGGSRMAKLISEPDIVEFLELIMLREGVDVNLVEISCEGLASCFINISLAELNVRRKTGANVIGIKLANGQYLFNPGGDYILTQEDKMFVLGKPSQVEKLEKILQEESCSEK